MSRRAARGPRWLRPVMGVGLGLGLLLLAEAGARAAGVAPAYAPDRIGGWHLLPEQDQIVRGVREPHAFRLVTNADGLRTSLPRERTPGVRRVAIMGDSTTFGWGADEGGTVADGLQEGLRSRGITDVEVLNAAQPGYSTTQVARFFEAVVKGYQPDLLVVFLPMHDHNLVLVSDREHLEGASGLLPRARVALATRSRLFEALRRALVPLSDRAFLVPGEAQTPEPRVPRVSDAEREENLSRMQDTLDSWGGKLAIGHLPFIRDLTSPQAGDRPGLAWATAWAARTGTPVVDLRACCGPNGGDLVFSFDPGHLTAEGNLQAGRFGAGALAGVLGSAAVGR